MNHETGQPELGKPTAGVVPAPAKPCSYGLETETESITFGSAADMLRCIHIGGLLNRFWKLARLGPRVRVEACSHDHSRPNERFNKQVLGVLADQVRAEKGQQHDHSKPS